MVEPSSRKVFCRDLLWPLLIAALIVTASSRPRIAGPDISPWDDKAAHFAVYGLLATLVCRLGRRQIEAKPDTGGWQRWRWAAWSLAIVAAFGATDEWHQSFVPGRSSELLDWIADTLGAATATALYTGWTRYRRLLEKPLRPAASPSGKLDTPPAPGLP